MKAKGGRSKPKARVNIASADHYGLLQLAVAVLGRCILTTHEFGANAAFTVHDLDDGSMHHVGATAGEFQCSTCVALYTCRHAQIVALYARALAGNRRGEE